MAALVAAGGGVGGAFQDAIGEFAVFVAKGDKGEEEITAAVQSVLDKLQAWVRETFRRDAETHKWPKTAITALNSVVEVLQRTGTEVSIYSNIWIFCIHMCVNVCMFTTVSHTQI